MSGPKPTRSQGDLAEMLETLLDKGVVVNADVVVTVGDTELLGVQIRAAIASFETAARYGLEFPSGTDMDRVADAAGLEEVPRDRSIPGVEASTVESSATDGGTDRSADGDAEDDRSDGTDEVDGTT